MKTNIPFYLPTIIILLRYFLFAGGAYCLFYIIKNKQYIHRKIQKVMPRKKQIINEIANSLVSIGIFSLFIFILFWAKKNGISRIYTDIHLYGIPYFIMSYILLIFIHDTYFYWMHRLMHHPLLFKKIHATHHRSHNPTPFASFSFHPIEAIIEFGIVFIVFILPIHQIIMLLFGLTILLFNIIGHLGFELFPTDFLQRPIGKILNTSTHHNMHHQYSNANFGLYFNFWDAIMKTNHKKYTSNFERITNIE